MKYKKNLFANLAEENDGFKETFQAAKKIHKDNRIKYMIKRKRALILKIVLAILLVFSIVFSAFLYFFSGYSVDDNFDKSSESLGLVSDAKINNEVTNIAFFGLDTRKGEKVGRSDSIMILTLDGIHNKLKITSILRDSRVKIDGHGRDKLCHAFVYGGANLAVKTLNKNFRLDIRDYVALNFGQLIHIIDAVGGIDVKIKRSQVGEINGIIASTPEYCKSPKLSPFKQKSKVVHLNGAQALSYSRMRKKDDEPHRAARQRLIVDLLFQKILNVPPKEYPGLVRRLMPFTKTSLSFKDILKFVPFVLNKKPTIEKFVVPDNRDSEVKGGIINGVWYWTYSLKKYSVKLHRFLYEN